MSLSASDTEFVGEVSAHLAQEAERVRTDTAAHIEDYLRRRGQEMREAAELECAHRVAEVQTELWAAAAARDTATSVQQRRSGQLARAQGQAAATAALRCRFDTWRRWRDGRREACERAALCALFISRQSLYHFFLQWRLFAAARRQTAAQQEEGRRQRGRESELLGQLEAYRAALEKERRRNDELDGRLREAFVKGMTALNREAVSALRGSTAEEDAAAIHDILTGKSSLLGKSSSSASSEPPPPPSQPLADPQRHSRSSFARHQAPAATAPAPADVCPVHHTDAAGRYFHPCYDARHCPYGPQASADSSITSGGGSSAHQAFVVRADSRSVRSYDAGAPVAQARPSAARRWK